MVSITPKATTIATIEIRGFIPIRYPAAIVDHLRASHRTSRPDDGLACRCRGTGPSASAPRQRVFAFLGWRGADTAFGGSLKTSEPPAGP